MTRAFGQFAFAGTGFGLIALLEVGLGVPDHFSQELGNAGGVVGLFKGVTFEGVGNFRITFPLGLTAHGQVHAHFRAFSGKVVLQAGPNLRVASFGNTQHVLTGPLGTIGLFFDLDKLFGLGVAYRAFCGGSVSFVYVSAHQASEFLFHNK